MSIYIFSQFRRFYFNTVEQILAYGYFGKIRKNALPFKTHVSIKCIVKLSIRIYYPTPSTLFWFYFIRHSQFKSMYLLCDNSSILIFFGSDGKLLDESTASICKGVAIKNGKSGNFGALIRIFLVRSTELKAPVECDE